MKWAKFKRFLSIFPQPCRQEWLYRVDNCCLGPWPGPPLPAIVILWNLIGCSIFTWGSRWDGKMWSTSPRIAQCLNLRFWYWICRIIFMSVLINSKILKPKISQIFFSRSSVSGPEYLKRSLRVVTGIRWWMGLVLGSGVDSAPTVPLLAKLPSFKALPGPPLLFLLFSPPQKTRASLGADDDGGGGIVTVLLEGRKGGGLDRRAEEGCW